MVSKLRMTLTRITAKALRWLLSRLDTPANENHSQTPAPSDFAVTNRSDSFDARTEIEKAMAYIYSSKEHKRRREEDDRTKPSGVFGLPEADLSEGGLHMIDGPGSLSPPRF